MKPIIKPFLFILILILITTCAQNKEKDRIQVLELDIPENTIPEGITVDSNTGEIFVGSVHLNTITKSTKKGRAGTTFLPKNYCGYSAGVGMEIFENKLYALGSFNRKERSILVIKDLDDSDDYNAICFSMASDIKSYFNDLAVDNFGNAYMTDTNAHKIYFFDVETNAINVFMIDEQIQYPNGIAISKDNSKLFIDSYTHGIRIVDIKSKKILNKPHKASSNIGIDGLKFHNGTLYAVRNGGKDKTKHGLYQYILNESNNDILEMNPLVINHEKMNIPTTVAISDNFAFVLANSQLDNLDQDKNEIINAKKLEPIYVLKVRLD